MQFIPEMPDESQEVPYYDDVTSGEGWQGHSTGKSIDKLKSEVAESITRLGGIVTSFQRGKFIIEEQEREGYIVNYLIEHDEGLSMRGQISVAALPVRDTYRLQRSLATRKEKSLKMALFMLRNALDGTWFLQQLSPGYAPLMPWMLEETSGRTITQLWSEQSVMKQLLPPSEGDFIEGDFEEVDS